MATRPLKGSERTALPQAHAIAAADEHERLEASVILRPQARAALAQRVSRLARGDRSGGALSREAFAAAHGASAADLAAVQAFAHAHGLSVVQEHAARRTLVLSGTVGQFNRAFDIELKHYAYPGGTYRGREGAIHIPEELADIVEAVLGLDNRPQARPHFRIRRPGRRGGARSSAPRRSASDRTAPDRTPSASVSYPPTQVASLYDFPRGSAQGECVAIIELGGGYRPQDLDTYFATLGVASPTVTAVSVDHGANQPSGDPNGPDGEVMLDIEVVGAIATGASLAVYFAPNTDAGFLDAVTSAIHDDVRKPSVISISWGGPESSWTSQAMTAMDQAFQAAAALGVTVCVASGDGGSSDGVSGGAAHVDFPASSPFALGCGGTSLRASGNRITSESVWNDQSTRGGAGGGGVSGYFAVPDWQHGLTAATSAGVRTPLSGRGVPDVAGDADPQTGYEVRIDGSQTVIGGTSAVAPLWAGLLALANALNGRAAGYVNPLLYAHPAALHDITQGNNGGFEATVGWDACTGLGSPIGQQVAALVAPAADS
ncbi:MAG TPA: S53 family peptidase [Steroidobacteraceae bacterium]|nr:S53 family peptidase [Steroidobacteraceae bacterium]